MLTGFKAILEYEVFKFQVTVADLASVHVVESKQKLKNYVGTVSLIKSLALVDLCLHLTTLVEWNDQI